MTLTRHPGFALKLLAGVLVTVAPCLTYRGCGPTEDTLSTFLNGDSSLLSVRQRGLEQDKEDIATDRSDLDSRISAMEARLKSQFLYNDSIIQKLNTTQDFIKQQFDVLNAGKD